MGKPEQSNKRPIKSPGSNGEPDNGNADSARGISGGSAVLGGNRGSGGNGGGTDIRGSGASGTGDEYTIPGNGAGGGGIRIPTERQTQEDVPSTIGLDLG